MKALSIKQPWANFIADGEKTIETRTWSTAYRGSLLIVSSKKPDLENFPEMLVKGSGPYGCAVATARLAECRPMRPEDAEGAGCDFYTGAFAWVLEDIKRIKPFPVKGSQGLYEVDDALIKVLETKGESHA